jgi:hypothetical protein
MVLYTSTAAHLDPQDHETLRTAVLSPKLLGTSPLLGTFAATYGFAVSFTQPGMHALLQQYPFFAPFCRLMLYASWTKPVLPWRRRFFFRPNAFYLNVLAIPPGAHVGMHIDATLGTHCKNPGVIPEAVSVYYVQVPLIPAGGALVLHPTGKKHIMLTPTEGHYVVFRGDLPHEVTAYHGHDLRVSLVCEQYQLDASSLHAMRPMHVQSKGQFAAVLREHRRTKVVS